MLIPASRFLVLLGLALWIGLPLSLWLQSRILLKNHPKPLAQEITATLIPAMDRFLLAAMVFVVAGNAMMASTLKVLPSDPVLVTLGAIVVLRLLGAFAISTALRALRARNREATATDNDRRAFQRLLGTSMLLIGIEGALAIALLFQVS